MGCVWKILDGWGMGGAEVGVGSGMGKLHFLGMSLEVLPRVMADGPLAPFILESMLGKVSWVEWSEEAGSDDGLVEAIYTYGHPRVDGAMMDRFPRLRVVSNYGVGVDHIDLVAAALRGIPVGNTPGILDGATADMGFALLLACARRVVEGDAYARSAEFTVYDPGYLLGTEVHSSTLGIVGMGRIGLEVARRGRGFGMRVLYHNRSRRLDAEGEIGVEYAGFDALLAESDFIVLCCPLTGETRGLMDARAFSRMKRTSVLVNIARGGVVDTGALVEALRTGLIAGAGIDVTEPEPLPRDHPLLSMRNVVIAPHLGSATVQTRKKMAERSLANLRAGLDGEPLPFRIGG
jgi:glyoxylate reductase